MLDNFPGLLGYGNIIAIHADWPVYPPEMGWRNALLTLGNFPHETQLYEIDNIDKCILFINKNSQSLTDPFDDKYYHAAIWHEDLIELEERGFVSGVNKKSNYEFDLFKFENFKKNLGSNLKEDQEGNIILLIKGNNGKFEEIKYNKPVGNQEEEELEFKNWAVVTKYLSLTDKGIEELIKLSTEICYIDELFELINPLVNMGRFDTAIREASLYLESAIKEFHNVPSLYGQKLLEYHIEQLIRKNGNFNSAAIKCYRSELRTIFKFIRNDFAHNFKVLTREQCILILFRLNNVLKEFNEVISIYLNT